VLENFCGKNSGRIPFPVFKNGKVLDHQHGQWKPQNLQRVPTTVTNENLEPILTSRYRCSFVRSVFTAITLAVALFKILAENRQGASP
jgi:hypothetical protein